MKVEIVEGQSKNIVEATIKEARLADLPFKKQGWQFSWRTLYKTEGATLYQLQLLDDTSELEGMLMLSVMNKEMVYMNNIEVAPHNLGSKGKHDHVAGCLIAYGCLKSFEWGENAYTGYLTFESKTQLISLYQKKYGATLAIGQRMFIDPEAGLKLIHNYLKA